MGQAAIPILLTLAGSGVSIANTNRTARKRDEANAEGIRRQAEEQRLANAKINETLDFFEKSGPDDIRESLSSRFKRQLALKKQDAFSGFETAGGSSDAFKALVADRKGDISGQADVLQGLFADIDAPSEQRLLEGFERGDLGSDLSVTKRNSRAEDFLTRLRVASIRRNPLLDLLSAGLSGAGQGAAFGGKTPITPITPASTGATVGSSGVSPQVFFDPRFADIFNRPQKVTPGAIFGR